MNREDLICPDEAYAIFAHVLRCTTRREMVSWSLCTKSAWKSNWASRTSHLLRNKNSN